MAGNDLLLYGDHKNEKVDDILKRQIPRAFSFLKQAVISGKIEEKDLEIKISKILKAKKNSFSYSKKNVSNAKTQENLYDIFNTKKSKNLKKKLFQEAICIGKDEGKIFPLSKENMKDKTMAYLSFRKNEKKRNGKKNKKEIEIENKELLDECLFLKKDHFYQNLNKILKKKLPFFYIENNTAEEKKLLKELSKYSYVLVGVFNIDEKNVENFGFSRSSLSFLDKLNKNTSLIITIFGTPYAMKIFQTYPTVLVAFEEDIDAKKAAAKVIFGKEKIKGKMPIFLEK